MGFVGVVLSLISIWLLWDNGWLFISIALAVALVELWSWGVMHNYATESAKNREGYSGGFYDLTPEEANKVPNWLATMNLAGFVVAVGLLIFGIVA